MTEAELRAQIAADVVSVGASSEPMQLKQHPDGVAIDVHVVRTIDENGTTQEDAQRIHVFHRGQPNESATIADRRVRNHRTPPSSQLEFYLSREQEILAAVPQAQTFVLGELTSTGQLPIQFRNSMNQIVTRNNTTTIEDAWYLVLRLPNDQWRLVPYRMK